MRIFNPSLSFIDFLLMPCAPQIRVYTAAGLNSNVAGLGLTYNASTMVKAAASSDLRAPARSPGLAVSVLVVIFLFLVV